MDRMFAVVGRKLGGGSSSITSEIFFEKGSMVECAVVKHLHKPPMRVTPSRVEQVAPSPDKKKNILHEIFGFAGIPQNLPTDAEN